MAGKATKGKWCCLEIKKLLPAKEQSGDTSQTYSEVAEVWGLSHQEFQRTTINMLRTLTEKVDNMPRTDG